MKPQIGIPYRVLIRDSAGVDRQHKILFITHNDYLAFMRQLYEMQTTWSSPSSPRWQPFDRFAKKRGWPESDTDRLDDVNAFMEARARDRLVRGFEA